MRTDAELRADHRQMMRVMHWIAFVSLGVLAGTLYFTVPTRQAVYESVIAALLFAVGLVYVMRSHHKHGSTVLWIILFFGQKISASANHITIDTPTSQWALFFVQWLSLVILIISTIFLLLKGPITRYCGLEERPASA